MIKTFGRAYDNTVVINNPDISSRHAKVTLLENGNYFVEDLNSTNGIYVNGYRIQKATITPKDELRLSETSILNLPDIFGQQIQKQPSQQASAGSKNFTAEFVNLKPVWEDYQKIKIDINKKYQRKSTVIRSVLSLAPLAFYTVFQATYLSSLEISDPEHAKWQNSFIYFAGIGGALGNLIGGLMIPSPQEKLTMLDEEFRVRYVCPNPSCRTQLGGVPWLSYYNQGKCFRCQAIYSNEYSA